MGGDVTINLFPHTGTITTSAAHKLGTVIPASAFRVLAKYTSSGTVTIGTESFTVFGTGQKISVGSFTSLPTLTSTNAAVFYATDLKGNILNRDTVTTVPCRFEESSKTIAIQGLNFVQSTAFAMIPNVTVAVGDTFTYGSENYKILLIYVSTYLSKVFYKTLYF
jgi:hypothetical protein